jgi:hypothetical protein
MRAEEVIYEKCSACGNDVKPEHGFRIDGDRVSHIDCMQPEATPRAGKVISTVPSKEGGDRWDGVKQDS